MSTIQAIKQLEERNVASEITLMIWSERMDLVALANVKGEVTLHRLTWTKAWTLSPPQDGLTVSGISWRPDGKIIAIAYSSGTITLVKVENKNILYTKTIEEKVSFLHWTQDKVLQKDRSSTTAKEDSEQNEYMKNLDLSSNFLPDVSSHSFDSNDETNHNSFLQEQTDFNMLLIGTDNGLVHIYIFGCFPYTTINLRNHFAEECSVQSTFLTEGLGRMLITVKDSNGNLKIVCVDSSIFHTHSNELFALGLKNIKLTCLLNYLANTISTITESWENILLEMDNKLSKYANRVCEGGVTADFLDLLMFGICSDEMNEFLIHDLTKKGLEKFGQTIEMSYSNIQKLLLKYILKMGQNITYHLAEMRGMARLKDRYQVLDLSESKINEAILSNGAFLIKGGEMQQIINHSITNYKAFFRWLYTAIMHVLEEQIPNEIPKMTQQDLAYITEFLQNFDHIGKDTKQGFIMERLGQYLVNAPLSIKPDMTNSDWSGFLIENKCLAEHPSILRHFEDMSLLQQHVHLVQSIEKLFELDQNVISKQFHLRHVFNCFEIGDDFNMSQIGLDKDNVLFAFLQSPEYISVVKLNMHHTDHTVQYGKIYFAQNETRYKIIDFQFYTSTVLSVLLQENTNSILYQMNMESICLGNSTDTNSVNGLNVQNRLCKNLEGFVALQFAVSGSRRVGIVLAENKRKVRLYEMEGEEEEDEDTEMISGKDTDLNVSDVNSTL